MILLILSAIILLGFCIGKCCLSGAEEEGEVEIGYKEQVEYPEGDSSFGGPDTTELVPHKGKLNKVLHKPNDEESSGKVTGKAPRFSAE